MLVERLGRVGSQSFREAVFRVFALILGHLPPGSGKKAVASKLAETFRIDHPTVRRFALRSGAVIELDLSVPQFAIGFLTRDWEPAVVATLAAWLNPSMVLFDIGANIGLVGLAVATKTGASVHAFEPDSENVAMLRRNASLNPGTDIHIVAAAVSDVPHKVTLGGRSSMLRRVTAGGGVSVDAITVDDYVRDTGVSPAAMKIDVEGHEASVLQGAIGTLTSSKPFVVCEALDQAADRSVSDLLSSLGYNHVPLPGVGLQRLRRRWSASSHMLAFLPPR